MQRISLKGLILFIIAIPICMNAQNEAFFMQTNGDNFIELHQRGDFNLVNGFTSDLNQVEGLHGIIKHAAYQNSTTGGTNAVYIKQTNEIYAANIIFLNQSASENNIAHFTQQNGINTIMLNETSTAGSNETHITQLNGINIANIERNAHMNNTIPSSANTKMLNPLGYDGIHQEGSFNFIMGVEEYYENNVKKLKADAFAPARQISHSGSNWLEIWQTGGANLVGLYQEAGVDNTALINQQNGGNTALIFQKNMTGSNYLELEQMGNSSAIIYQSTISGSYNRAIVTQN